MPRKHKPSWFVYRIAPFRPLYLGSAASPPHFRAPASRMESSAAKHKPLIWQFSDRRAARLMAATNKADYAPFADFERLRRAEGAPVRKPSTAMKRERSEPLVNTTQTTLESLA